jgi:hypothetical protein
MKKAAGVARCGLSGKIDCQCNHNTLSPDNVEDAARLSRGGVLIAFQEVEHPARCKGVTVLEAHRGIF